MKINTFIGFIAMVCLIAPAARAVTTYANKAPGIGSQYGLVQNVQNYSSNPFWDPNGPYNQRMPQVVYAQGADLNTGDCQRTVGALIGMYCAQRNNCAGLRLSDVRPDLMVQLSQLPGHNFASACAGFIDSEFNSYVSRYANAGPVSGATFPPATGGETGSAPKFEIENPYKIKTPKWQQEAAERAQELKDLQSANGYGDVKLSRAAFPQTADDIPLQQRMANRAAGYEPFADKSAYRTITIEGEDEYRARRKKECQERIAPHVKRLQDDLAALQKCLSAGTKLEDCAEYSNYIETLEKQNA